MPSSPSTPRRRRPVPGRLPHSLAASLALHGVVYAALAAGVTYASLRGRAQRTPPPPVVFAAPSTVEPPPERPPEPPPRLPEERLDERPELREVEVAMAELPEPLFDPVQLEPSPLRRARFDALHRPRYPAPPSEPEPPPPTADAPQVTPEPPPVEAPPEPVGQETPDSAPTPIPELCASPPYPARAMQRGWQGTVVCLITVAADGTVVSVELEESSGYRVLDQAALEGLRAWVFEPALRGGEPARDVVRWRVEFRL